GSLPFDRFGAIAMAVHRAEALTQHAINVAAGAPTQLVAGPVAQAERLATEQLLRTRHELAAAGLLLEGLPHFLGANGPREYFVGAANPAELRGSAGLIGAYSILTIDAGSFHLAPF